MTQSLYMYVLMCFSCVYSEAKSAANQQGFDLFVNSPTCSLIPCPAALVAALVPILITTSQALVASLP